MPFIIIINIIVIIIVIIFFTVMVIITHNGMGGSVVEGAGLPGPRGGKTRQDGHPDL